jgi:exopolysaccharide biosynthesis polyprenyl glycosylphosphotransferase
VRPVTSYLRRALAGDVLALVIAWAAVFIISPTGSPSGQVPDEPIQWSLLFSVLVIGLFRFSGLYKPPLRLDALDTLRVLFAQTAFAAVLTMGARVILTNQPYVAAETIRHWIPAVLLLAGARMAVLWLEGQARARDEGGRPTVVVGAGQIGRRAAGRLIEDPELGLRPVAFMDDEPLDGDPLTEGLPVFPLETDLAKLMQSYGVSHVIIAFSRAGHDDLLRIGRRAWELGLTLSVVPRLFEIEGERSSTEHLGGLPLVQFRHSDPQGWQFRVKYAMDRLVAGVALLLLAPLLACAALAVLISLGRPLLFRQPRVGLDGREFDMLKFRTLRGAPGEADADWAASQLGARVAAEFPPHVPMTGRITRTSAFLRRYCIDELPQLFNVLRGDMSLIGPRPERTFYVRQFGGEIYRYAERHRVKSGLTGWAQIHGLRGATSLAERVEWDNHYIENWSLWMDVKIAMRTVPAVFRGTWTATEDSREWSAPLT